MDLERRTRNLLARIGLGLTRGTAIRRALRQAYDDGQRDAAATVVRVAMEALDPQHPRYTDTRAGLEAALMKGYHAAVRR
jgi:hypothetical protein